MCFAFRLGVQRVVHDLLHLLPRNRGLGPAPLADLAQLGRPPSANRARHARTVVGDTPTAAAMRSLACPSAAINNALARSTCRCGAVCDRDNFSNTDR